MMGDGHHVRHHLTQSVNEATAESNTNISHLGAEIELHAPQAHWHVHLFINELLLPVEFSGIVILPTLMRHSTIPNSKVFNEISLPAPLLPQCTKTGR